MTHSSVCEIDQRKDVLLVVVSKRSLDDQSTRTLVDCIQTAAAQHLGVPIVLDLQKLKFAPSVAIGAIVQLSKSFQLDRRRVALVGVDRRVRDSIAVTRLDQYLEIHDTLERAIGESEE